MNERVVAGSGQNENQAGHLMLVGFSAALVAFFAALVSFWTAGPASAQAGSTWQQVAADINGEAVGDFAGSSVSLAADGRTVAVGSRGPIAGQVRVFERSGAGWVQVGPDF